MKAKLLTILCLCCTVVIYASIAQTTIFKVQSGRVDFKSEAPLELIKASSNQLVGLLDTKSKNFAFKIYMKSFDGFNGATQKEHYNENYIESDKFPEASYQGKLIDEIDFTKEGIYTVRTKGRLLIHGVEQERIIKSELTVTKDKMLLKSNFMVLLSDFNIPIPKVVSMKLANEIDVQLVATLVPR